MNMIDITPVINAVIALLAAAEQLYEGQGRGEEKKKYVLEFLASVGFTVDEEAVNAAIEAAVNQLNGGNLPLE